MELVEALKVALGTGINPEYLDFTLLKEKGFSLAYRGESQELVQSSDELLVARAVNGGYGIASSNEVSTGEAKRLASIALENARMATPVRLAPVKPEKGSIERKERYSPMPEEASRLLKYIVGLFHEKLKELRHHVELVFEFRVREKRMSSTDGHEIAERIPYTTLVLFASAEGKASASEVVGGQGGLEVLTGKDFEAIIDVMIKKIRDSLRGRLLSPMARGGKFDVILDEAAAGFLAHELAHALEADSFNPGIFSGIKPTSYMRLYDDPALPYGFGSRVWDDEGVRSVKKELLSKDGISLLHTRLTAGERERPGNARGMLHKPKALMSNVYIAPGDWRVEELFEETKEGIFIKGAVKAELDLSSGIFTMKAESAYYYKKGEGFIPLVGLTLHDTVRRIVSSLDATTKVARLRPNIERGYPVADGGPYVRLSKVRCA